MKSDQGLKCQTNFIAEKCPVILQSWLPSANTRSTNAGSKHGIVECLWTEICKSYLDVPIYLSSFIATRFPIRIAFVPMYTIPILWLVWSVPFLLLAIIMQLETKTCIGASTYIRVPNMN